MTSPPTMPAISSTAARGVLDALRRRGESVASAGVHGGEGGLSPSQIISEAEEHWNVSGSSVLVAWLATAIGSAIAIFIFSWRRPKDELIYRPRKAASTKRIDKLLNTNKHMGYTRGNFWDNGIFVTQVPKECCSVPAIYVPSQELSEKDQEKEGSSEKTQERIFRRERYKCSGCGTVIVDGEPPGFLSWLKPAWDDCLVEIWPFGRSKRIQKRSFQTLALLGLDAASMLQFLRLLRWLFTYITILVALPLTCANYYINTHTSYGRPTTAIATPTRKRSSESSSSSVSAGLLDNMQLFTAANVTGNGLYVHILFERVITCLVILFFLSHSRQHKHLVEEWTKINRDEISFKSILITNLNIQKGKLPKPLALVGGELCARIGISERSEAPDISQRCAVVLTQHNMGALHETMEKYKKDHFAKLESVATSALRSREDKSGPGEVYDGCWHRLTDKPRDLITHLGLTTGTTYNEYKKIEAKREAARRIAIEKETIGGKPLMLKETISSALITFVTPAKAYDALKLIRRVETKQKKGVVAQRAPRSKNIIWKNLEKTTKSRRAHALIGRILLVVFCFLNTIPLMAITLLANLDTVIEQIPKLNALKESSGLWKAFFTVIGGILPASIAAAFAYLLPYVMRFLSRWSGALTRGQLDKDVIKQLFVFMLISNFVIFSLLGVIYESYLTVSSEVGVKSWSEMYGDLGNVPAKIIKAYITESSYWLSWYPIRSAVAVVQLLQIPRWLLKVFQGLFWDTTGSKLHEITQPVAYEYHIEYSHVIFAVVVALGYSPLAPLVVVCSTIYFWTVSIVIGNQLKWVEDTKETDGKSWNLVMNRLMVAVLLMQCLMGLTVYSKTSSPLMTTLALIPILPTTLLIDCRLTRYLHQKSKQNSWFKILSWYKAPSIGDLIKFYDKSKIDIHEAVPHFEHDILKDDWGPEFWLDKSLKPELLKATEEDPRLATLTGQGRGVDDEKRGSGSGDGGRKGKSWSRSRSKSSSRSRARSKSSRSEKRRERY